MNPYFQLVMDVLTLMETKEFAAIINDIRAIEGGAGASITSPGAHAALKQAIALAEAKPAPTPPASVPGPHRNPRLNKL